MKLSQVQLDDLKLRRRTVKAVALELGITPNYLSEWLSANQIKRNLSAKHQQRLHNTDLYATRRQYRAQLAREVVLGDRTMAQAAKEAGCTVRTMYRHYTRVKAQLKEFKCEPTSANLLSSSALLTPSGRKPQS